MDRRRLKTTSPLIILSLVTLGLFVTTGADAQRGKPRKAKVIRTKKATPVKAKPAKVVVVKKTRAPRAKRRKPVAKATWRFYRNQPKRGAVVASIATTALKINYSQKLYRYHKGIWYRPQGNQFLVVNPPLGIRITTLPPGYRKVAFGPRIYFYYHGVFYTKSVDKSEYTVVAPPAGAEVDELPDGGRMEIVDDVEYYVVDDVYYKAIIDELGETAAYEVVYL